MTSQTTNNIVLFILAIFLGIFYIFFGTIKVSLLFSDDINGDIEKNFVNFAKVVPVLSQLGYHVCPKHYRLIIGYTETFFGFVLAFIPGPSKLVANAVLWLITMLTIYNHYMVKDTFVG